MDEIKYYKLMDLYAETMREYEDEKREYDYYEQNDWDIEDKNIKRESLHMTKIHLEVMKQVLIQEGVKNRFFIIDGWEYEYWDKEGE